MRYIIVPQLTDDNGYWVKMAYPPTGYHHIVKTYPNGEFMLLATIDGEIPLSSVEQIAKLVIPENCTAEVEEDFYTEAYKKLYGK